MLGLSELLTLGSKDQILSSEDSGWGENFEIKWKKETAFPCWESPAGTINFFFLNLT